MNDNSQFGYSNYSLETYGSFQMAPNEKLIYGHVINHVIINDPFKNGEFIQESLKIYVLGQAGDKINLSWVPKETCTPGLQVYSWPLRNYPAIKSLPTFDINFVLTPLYCNLFSVPIVYFRKCLKFKV